MRSSIRLLILATFFSAAVFGTARFSGEKGVRAHRIRLAAGYRHACAIRDDGTVACWGLNNNGQVGDGTSLLTRTSPVPVTNLGQAVSISTGEFHSCAILSASGALRCWGENSSRGKRHGQHNLDCRWVPA
jgi:alpha-tubulin suppressor-like RCC1 family protein